jgi:hypothetical protein
MTTSARTQFLSETLESSRIPERQLEYFRARLMLRLYHMIQSTFQQLSKSKKGFSKAYIARRLGKGPDQITRWMNSPSNLEIKTVSDLLLAMGREPVLDIRDLELGAIAPTREAWLHQKPDAPALQRSNAPTQDETREHATLALISVATTDFSIARLADPNIAVKKGALAAMTPQPPVAPDSPHFAPPEIKNPRGASHAIGGLAA